MADKEVSMGYVRQRFRDLEPNSPDENNKAYAGYISVAPATPLGHETFNITNTASSLPSIPSDAKRAVIVALTGAFSYTDHGADPSASRGIPIQAMNIFIYDTEPLSNVRVWAAVTTEARVAYYG